MKNTKAIAAHIAAKKAIMNQELAGIDISVKKGGMTISQFGKSNTRKLVGIERQRIYKKSCRGTRSITKEMAAIYGVH